MGGALIPYDCVLIRRGRDTGMLMSREEAIVTRWPSACEPGREAQKKPSLPTP